jgi:hypothetical protein
MVSVGPGQTGEVGGEGGATLTFGGPNLNAAKSELDPASVRQDGPIRKIAGMIRLVTESLIQTKTPSCSNRVRQPLR